MTTSPTLRVGIIGAGVIGQRRAQNLCGAQLAAVADLRPEAARALAAAHGASAEVSWDALVERKDIDIVVVATTNDAFMPCVTAALRAGKHVLAEKPAGRGPADIEALIASEKTSRGILRIGFNHRFHPGLQLMKRCLEGGSLGPVLYVRARYGHGGRLGYETEWRADPERSGGGELLDQGVHLIDLTRWLVSSDFELGFGHADTFFWKMAVEDNGFLFLRASGSNAGASGHAPVAWLHASCTEWKNLFDFEIFCERGKLQVRGLGRSYGTEEFLCYRMRPEMGPPILETQTFPGEDVSWQEEFSAFLKEISGKKTDIANSHDALRAASIVRDVYQGAHAG